VVIDVVILAVAFFVGLAAHGMLERWESVHNCARYAPRQMSSPPYIYGSHAHIHSLRTFLPGGSDFAALVETWSSEDVAWCVAVSALEEAGGMGPLPMDAVELFGRGEILRASFPVSSN
jgi:hypothetical protein